MEGDKLSDLPDCLLHDILSRLKARQVVQTCVLSRRWEHIWRSVPCLDVDHRDLGSTAEVFEDFADNLLSRLSVSSLDTFRLNVGKKYSDSSEPPRWVRRALKQYSPAVLDVRSSSNLWQDRVSLPSLVPGSHRLTRLYLGNARLESRGIDDQFASASGFPVLEVLELTRCSYRLRRIESSTLKSLTIHDCSNTGENDVVIAAPRLASLRLGISFQRENRHCRYLQPRAGGFTVDEAPSLVRASISVVDSVPYICEADQITLQSLALFRTVRKLLGSLSNVSSLELSGFKATSGQRAHIILNDTGLRWDTLTLDIYEEIALESFQSRAAQGGEFAPVPLLQAVLDEARGNLPIFGNLKTLVLDECYISNNLQTLWRFLLHTPILEKLTLQRCKFPDDTRRKKTRNMLNKVPNLKLVEIKYKDGYEHGFNEILQQMSIKYKEQETLLRDKVSSGMSRKLPKTTVQVTEVESNCC